MRWNDYMDAQGGRDRPGNDSFPSENQQAQAASRNKLSANPGNNGGDQTPENGAIAAQNSGADLDPNREAPDGQSFSTNHSATTAPSPGSATDRGYGNTGQDNYGTGVGDTGLSSGAGRDERDFGTDNPDLSPTSDDLSAGDFGQTTERRD